MSEPNAPWYKSAVLRGIALIVISRILARFHIEIPGVAAGDVVDTLLDLATLGGAAYAAWARVKHPLPNLTTTQAKADAANAAPPVPPVSKTESPA